MADKLLPILILEVICITLFIVPKTRIVGFFLICSYLGGAIAVNFVLGLASLIAPGLLLALFWLGMYLKYGKFFFTLYPFE